MMDPIPCPFCGSANVIQGRYLPPAEPVWSVFCQNEDCEATGPPCDTEAAAIAAWNRRPQVARLEALNAELARKLGEVELERTRWRFLAETGPELLGIVDADDVVGLA